MSTPYTVAELRTIGVLASADPRTCAAFIRGERVRGHVAVRIAAALAQLGYGAAK